MRKVLFFDVPDDEMVKRVLARAEKDAEKGEKRSDDTEEGIKKRLATNKYLLVYWFKALPSNAFNEEVSL